MRHKTENKEAHCKPTYRLNSQVPPCNQYPSSLHTSHPTDRKIKIYSLEKLNKDTAFSVPGTVMTTKDKENSKNIKLVGPQHPSLLGPRVPTSNIYSTGRWQNSSLKKKWYNSREKITYKHLEVTQ